MIREYLSIIYRKPFTWYIFLLSNLICKIRSLYYSTKIDNGGGSIIITEPFLKFKLKKHPNSELYIRGNLKIIPHEGGNSPIVISINSEAKLKIDGDFIIGQGVRFFLAPKSIMVIGGTEKESCCGITSDTLIMVYKNVTIGNDFVCSWNIFITDSDWHQIKGQNHQADVKIGNHVWIANSNNILKGTIIGDNCIVASNSKIVNKNFPNNVLIGGIPPKILKQNIDWSRDINE